MTREYGPVPNGPTHGRLGVIVATEPRGDLANLIYCTTDQPLFMVPRRLYKTVHKPSVGGRGGAPLRYKDPLSVGDQVEFALDENRRNTVLWMMKSPSYLPINCRSGGSLRMNVIAAVTTFEDEIGGLGLWNPRYNYVEATAAQVSSQPIGVPLWCCIEIVVSYGEYEGQPAIPINRNFKPYYWFRLVDYLDKTVDPIEGVEFLKNAPRITAMLENAICEGNRDESASYALLETFFDRAAGRDGKRRMLDPYGSLETVFDRAARGNGEAASDAGTRPPATNSFNSLETVFDRAGGVRKRSDDKKATSVTGAGEKSPQQEEGDPVDKELTAWMKKVLSIG